MRDRNILGARWTSYLTSIAISAGAASPCMAQSIIAHDGVAGNRQPLCAPIGIVAEATNATLKQLGFLYANEEDKEDREVNIKSLEPMGIIYYKLYDKLVTITRVKYAQVELWHTNDGKTNIWANFADIKISSPGHPTMFLGENGSRQSNAFFDLLTRNMIAAGAKHNLPSRALTCPQPIRPPPPLDASRTPGPALPEIRFPVQK